MAKVQCSNSHVKGPSYDTRLCQAGAKYVIKYNYCDKDVVKNVCESHKISLCKLLADRRVEYTINPIE